MEKLPTIVCVDDRSPLSSLQSLQTLLKNAGYPVHFEFFSRSDDFESWLENVATADLPTSYLLDSTPYYMGWSAAEAILKRFERDNRYGPQPLLCITSARPELSLQLAEDILGRFPHANVHLADAFPDMETNLELWENLLASPPVPVSKYPPTYGLRDMINRELGLNVSLEITPSTFGREVEIIRRKVSSRKMITINPTIFFLNDSQEVHTAFFLFEKGMRDAGYPITFRGFKNAEDLRTALSDQENMPDAYIFDSTPFFEGDTSAIDVFDRFTEAHPSGPHPLICFTSGNMDVALQACGKMLRARPNSHVHLVDSFQDEVDSNFILSLIRGDSPPTLPRTYGLRKILNRVLDLNIPLTVSPSNLGRDFEILRQGDLSSLSLSEIVARDQHRKFENFSSFAAAIETPLLDLDRRVRAGAEATLLPPSLFLPDGTEVSFSGAVGRPVQGPVVFSLDDIPTSPSPPVLVMNQWPAYGTLFPYFNQLAGVVILSQELADHTEAVLSNYRLSGVFGLAVNTGHGAFIEAPVIDLPDGKQMAKGDFVALRTREINPESTETSLSAEDSNALRYITEAYLDYLLANSRNTNIPVFKVNASAAPEETSFPKQIGLFRTEELASSNPSQMKIITKIMQGQATEGDFSYLEKLLYADYTKLLHAVDPHHGSPRIRLFDFRVQDHFPPEDWRKAQYFVTKGDDALETYPDLYRTQLHALLSALHEYRCYSFSSQKMEIMMPSLQSKAGVETFLSMVKEKAEEAYFTRGKDYDVGIMAENLRLCQVIGEVAGKVDFISIGSNDLTTDVLQIERKDTAGRTAYRAKNGFDPFISPDPKVFEEIIPALVAQAQEANPDIVIDICGEHASQVSVVRALSEMGVRGFSVSPSDENLLLLPVLCYMEIYSGQRSSSLTMATPSPTLA